MHWRGEYGGMGMRISCGRRPQRWCVTAHVNPASSVREESDACLFASRRLCVSDPARLPGEQNLNRRAKDERKALDLPTSEVTWMPMIRAAGRQMCDGGQRAPRASDHGREVVRGTTGAQERRRDPRNTFIRVGSGGAHHAVEVMRRERENSVQKPQCSSIRTVVSMSWHLERKFEIALCPEVMYIQRSRAR